MNVYHKVLIELYTATGGRDSQVVDLKELVKGLGFLGSYDDIFKQLSRQGWVAETRRPDVVSITHWGIKEAKKVGGSSDGDSEPLALLVTETNKLKAELKEFGIILDEFADEKSAGSFAVLEKKFKQLVDTLSKIGQNV